MDVRGHQGPEGECRAYRGLFQEPNCVFRGCFQVPVRSNTLECAAHEKLCWQSCASRRTPAVRTSLRVMERSSSPSSRIPRVSERYARDGGFRGRFDTTHWPKTFARGSNRWISQSECAGNSRSTRYVADRISLEYAGNSDGPRRGACVPR